MYRPGAFQRRFFRRIDNPLWLAHLLDHLPDVYFYVKDRKSRFVCFNQALLQMRGLSAEEIVGRTDYDIHPHYLADQYIREDQQVMQGGAAIPNQVWMVPGHDGVLRWFISTKAPLFDSRRRVIGVAGVMRDFAKAESVLEPYQEMEEVLAHVVNHFEERIDVAGLAERVHLSISQFDRKFKQLFQMTPQQYILRVRLNAACQALASTDESLAAIALRTGFYDQSYFCKQFRKNIGLAPLQYRKRYRAK